MTTRQVILKLQEGYFYQEAFHKSCQRTRPVDKGRDFKTDYLWIA